MKQFARYIFKHRFEFFGTIKVRLLSTTPHQSPGVERQALKAINSEVGLYVPRDRALIAAKNKMLCEALQCSEDVAHKLIDNNIYFLVKREENVKKKAFFVRQHFALEDIVNHPELLTLSIGPIEQHFLIMKDFGFCNITCSTLLAYSKLIKKSPNELIELKHMDDTCDPIANVLSVLSCREFTKRMKQELIYERYMTTPVQAQHRTLLPRYLAHRFSKPIADGRFVMDIHQDLMGRSFSHIKECFTIAREELRFPIEKIRVNPYLLHQDPRNMRAILALPSLMGGHPLEMVIKFPKVISMPVENLVKVEEILREYGVKDEVLRTCRYLFLLTPETVRDLIIKRRIEKMIGR